MAKSFVRLTPAILIGLRAVLGPSLIFFSMHGATVPVVVVLLAAMLSDIFDGVIARRIGVVTTKLRVVDSRVDAWFFLCVGISAVLAAPLILRAYMVPITIEVCLQAAAYTYDIARYGRITSLHAYSAKLWGFTLYLAAIGLLAFHSGILIWVAFVFGMLSAIDAMAIKLLIPEWKHDVLSTFHALRMREANLKHSG